MNRVNIHNVIKMCKYTPSHKGGEAGLVSVCGCVLRGLCCCHCKGKCSRIHRFRARYCMNSSWREFWGQNSSCGFGLAFGEFVVVYLNRASSFLGSLFLCKAPCCSSQGAQAGPAVPQQCPVQGNGHCPGSLATLELL